MLRGEYQPTLNALNLTEEQKEGICKSIENLTRLSRYYAQTNAEHANETKNPLGNLGYYYNGKRDGLNEAYQFFAGTLGSADAFEAD